MQIEEFLSDAVGRLVESSSPAKDGVYCNEALLSNFSGVNEGMMSFDVYIDGVEMYGKLYFEVFSTQFILFFKQPEVYGWAPCQSIHFDKAILKARDRIDEHKEQK